MIDIIWIVAPGEFIIPLISKAADSRK